MQYTAAASKTRKLTFRQRVGLVESSALRELGARLRERRNELEREFKARDPEATGKASPFVRISFVVFSVQFGVYVLRYPVYAIIIIIFFRILFRIGCASVHSKYSAAV